VNQQEQSRSSSTPKPSQPVSRSVLTPPQVIQHFSADEWEAFVLEALGASEPKYARIERRGGAGDKGRDVIACTADTPQAGPIDLYQCKAYGKALGLSDVWTEFGKLCVFTHRGDFPVPRRYRFAAPHGVTTPLGNLLDRPVELRTKLIENWAAQCEAKVSQGQTFPLTGDLKTYVEQFDFSIVHYRSVSELLDLHRKTTHWHVRFKRDYPARPKADMPPPDPQPHEMRYVRQLLDAYGQHTGTALADITALGAHSTLSQHFNGCRTDFFMADGLNRFYRDAQFPGAFEHVKGQVEQGIRNTVLKPHQDGYHRVCAVLEQAAGLPLAKTEYDYCVEAGDKQGICHHLANDDKLKWVQP
jgi:hypothetical protein